MVIFKEFGNWSVMEDAGFEDKAIPPKEYTKRQVKKVFR